jgi:hypothetical protein
MNVLAWPLGYVLLRNVTVTSTTKLSKHSLIIRSYGPSVRPYERSYGRTVSYGRHTVTVMTGVVDWGTKPWVV